MHSSRLWPIVTHVVWSVCVSVYLSRSQPWAMLPWLNRSRWRCCFGVELVGPRNHVLCGGLDHPTRRGIFGVILGHVQTCPWSQPYWQGVGSGAASGLSLLYWPSVVLACGMQEKNLDWFPRMRAMSLAADDGESEQNELRNLQLQLAQTNDLVETLSRQLSELKEQVISNRLLLTSFECVNTAWKYCLNTI